MADARLARHLSPKQVLHCLFGIARPITYTTYVNKVEQPVRTSKLQNPPPALLPRLGAANVDGPCSIVSFISTQLSLQVAVGRCRQRLLAALHHLASAGHVHVIAVRYSTDIFHSRLSPSRSRPSWFGMVKPTWRVANES